MVWNINGIISDKFYFFFFFFFQQVNTLLGGIVWRSGLYDHFRVVVVVML